MRKLGICLIIGLVFSVYGCSENKDTAKETKQVTDSNENKKDKNKESKSTEDTKEAPKIDENCAEVYSKEECEQFATYSQSNEGKEEAEASKKKPTEKNSTKLTEKEVYEKMESVLDQLGGSSEKLVPAPYEKGMVQKRPDGLYYINSTYELRGMPKGDEIYEFEMLVSDTFELIDAYLPGTYGRFSRPMKYDELNEYFRQQEEKEAIEKAKETPEDRERKKQEAEQKEKERQKVMEDIYGKEKVIDMDKETFGENK
ncbi:hypothetical protein P8807_09845 [Bacillus subtilis]|uniref:hypothetical protein n=1 Tax=Bacillus subtilis TaxID=1423 RepID=UPI000EF15A41|nr:hypothetical protein [Bacillus subtilis]AYK76635.1 hypothetical protein D9C12_23105 [Bacillus subtilis subsp. subtilis]AYL03265.1 hypothetical protein D9C08_23260 [Bacillus subtilis subsp. subtilis]MDQ4711626.1 hypothetical protein [Bacillus subtilis]MEC0326976.1 hypothetical protein [Bacillus subtilis]MEC0390520.1 hypothetical protein [Bacillus subtilis]